MKLTIKAEDNFDLSEFYDRILDGELGDLVTEGDVKAVRGGSAAFAGGTDRVPIVTIYLKEALDEEGIAELMAQLRAMLGNGAHIHIDT